MTAHQHAHSDLPRRPVLTGRELAAWKPSRARATFGAEAMLSVALSVALAHAFGFSDSWWAAISGFAVMQTSFSGSVQRAAHRMIGTVIGAALGTLLGPWIGDRPWLFVPVLGAIGGVTVYQANASQSGLRVGSGRRDRSDGDLRGAQVRVDSGDRVICSVARSPRSPSERSLAC